MNKTDKELAVELVIAQLQHNSKLSANGTSKAKTVTADSIAKAFTYYYSVLSEPPVNPLDHKE